MIIYSFDCAIRNLGFCCLKLNDNWRAEMANLILELNTFYDNSPDSKKEFLSQAYVILKKIDNLLSSILEIVYINVFDLIPGEKINAKSQRKILQNLKYVMYCLEQQLPLADVVLIEYQMNINDKSRGISRYIEDYYIPMEVDSDAKISYGLKHFPLIAVNLPELKHRCEVNIVSPSLKNAYNIDTSLEGEYSTFVEKYSKQYDANKAHSKHHFKYYLKIHNLSHIIDDCKNKLDDLADAFMMAYTWCKLNKLID